MARRTPQPPPEAADQADADPYEVARTIALRKLEQRARSRHELAEALRERGVPDDVAQAVLDRFTEVGLVDDRAFAEAWSESRQRSRHLSRRAIEAELYRKGVDRDTIGEVFAEHDSSIELANARAFAQSKSRSLERLDPDVARRRLAGALARRGFGSSIVWQVVGEEFPVS